MTVTFFAVSLTPYAYEARQLFVKSGLMTVAVGGVQTGGYRPQNSDY
jgi:hypothetical protein